jgi:hypothetical protein
VPIPNPDPFCRTPPTACRPSATSQASSAPASTGPKKPSFKLYSQHEEPQDALPLLPTAVAFAAGGSASNDFSPWGFSPRGLEAQSSSSMLDFPFAGTGESVTLVLPGFYRRPRPLRSAPSPRRGSTSICPHAAMRAMAATCTGEWWLTSTRTVWRACPIVYISKGVD